MEAVIPRSIHTCPDGRLMPPFYLTDESQKSEHVMPPAISRVTTLIVAAHRHMAMCDRQVGRQNVPHVTRPGPVASQGKF